MNEPEKFDPFDFIEKRFKDEMDGIVNAHLENVSRELNKIEEHMKSESERLSDYKSAEGFQDDFERLLLNNHLKASTEPQFPKGSFNDHIFRSKGLMNEAMESLKQRIRSLESDQDFASDFYELIELEIDSFNESVAADLVINGRDDLSKIWADIFALSRFVEDRSIK